MSHPIPYVFRAYRITMYQRRKPLKRRKSMLRYGMRYESVHGAIAQEEINQIIS